MPQFSDDLFLGPVAAVTRSPASTYGATGNPAEASLGVGPLGRVYVWDVVPLAAAANNIVNAQTTAGAGVVPMAYGAGIIKGYAHDGLVHARFDTPRCLTLQSSGNLSALTFTILGMDFQKQTVAIVIAGPNATTITTPKALISVTQITVNGAIGTAVNIGTSDVLGFPYALTDLGYLVSRAWNGAVDSSASVTLADGTSPATNATGDVRGRYALPSASNGTKRLVVVMALTGAACGPLANRIGAFGVSQAAI